MLEQCCNHLKQCCNNAVTLCCAKNRCCESSRVTSPLQRIGTLRSNDATATRMSLKKSICVPSAFIAIIPTHLLCQMSATPPEFEFQGPYPSSETEIKKFRRSLFTFSTKREIRHFHVVVVEKWQKSVMHVQSCCFAYRPFPHSCKQSHHLEAPVDKTQWFIWSCPPKPRPHFLMFAHWSVMWERSIKPFFFTFSLRWRRWIFKSLICEEENGLADALALLYGVRSIQA